MQERRIFFCCLFLLSLVLAGCSSLRSILSSHPASKSLYSGLKAKVSVADFEVMTSNADSVVAAGLRDMLVAALTGSRRFLIVERNAAQEKESPVDLIVTIKLNEFDPQSSGGKEGVGGGGGSARGALGGFLGNAASRAQLAFDVRIVDVATSAVISAKSIQTRSTEALVSGKPAAGSLTGVLTAYSNTPMEQVIRKGIADASNFVEQAVPSEYYKY